MTLAGAVLTLPQRVVCGVPGAEGTPCPEGGGPGSQVIRLTGKNWDYLIIKYPPINKTTMPMMRVVSSGRAVTPSHPNVSNKTPVRSCPIMIRANMVVAPSRGRVILMLLIQIQARIFPPPTYTRAKVFQSRIFHHPETPTR